MRKLALLLLVALLGVPLAACTSEQRDALDAAQEVQDNLEDLEDGEINGVNIEELSQKIEALQTAEYEVTYKQQDGTITIAQKPDGDQMQVSAHEEGDDGAESIYIDDLTNTFNCDKSATESNFSCTKTESFGLGTAVMPIGGAYFAVFLSLPLFLVGAPFAGVNVEESSDEFAGEQASCWKFTPPDDGSEPLKFCLLDSNGLLAYYEDGSSEVLELESFSDSVSDDAFEPPAGATITE